ncbi:MAG: hypothetical protein IJ571_06075 [Ruminococcus sp.]|nr:hypothetical protein [Ruminococcus sp.]
MELKKYALSIGIMLMLLILTGVYFNHVYFARIEEIVAENETSSIYVEESSHDHDV